MSEIIKKKINPLGTNCTTGDFENESRSKLFRNLIK